MPASVIAKSSSFKALALCATALPVKSLVPTADMEDSAKIVSGGCCCCKGTCDCTHNKTTSSGVLSQTPPVIRRYIQSSNQPAYRTEGTAGSTSSGLASTASATQNYYPTKFDHVAAGDYVHRRADCPLVISTGGAYGQGASTMTTQHAPMGTTLSSHVQPASYNAAPAPTNYYVAPGSVFYNGWNNELKETLVPFASILLGKDNTPAPLVMPATLREYFTAKFEAPKLQEEQKLVLENFQELRNAYIKTVRDTIHDLCDQALLLNDAAFYDYLRTGRVGVVNKESALAAKQTLLEKTAELTISTPTETIQKSIDSKSKNARKELDEMDFDSDMDDDDLESDDDDDSAHTDYASLF